MALEDYQFTSNQSHEKAVENGRKGGIASGESKRLKKSMKLALKELLEEEVKDKQGNSTGKTYQEFVNIGLLKGAMKGNANNYKVIAEMLGELNQEQNDNKVVPTINLNVVDNSNLEKIMYEKGGE